MSLHDLRLRLRQIIFGTYTPLGKAFDIGLILIILASVGAVMLASVPSYQSRFGRELYLLEWGFTLLFTLEYLLRCWTAKSARSYVASFYGLIDLVAILPTYLSLFIPGAEYLLVVRALRVLRVFRILKLLEFIDGENIIRDALWNSRYKITVFLVGVGILVMIVGSLMYLIEGEASGFTSIPRGVYWAVVTLTTVGYGDISPQSPAGQFAASIVMLIGYAIIAVPTGIVTSEIARKQFAARRPEPAREIQNDRFCGDCGCGDHQADSIYCRQCGARLPEVKERET